MMQDSGEGYPPRDGGRGGAGRGRGGRGKARRRPRKISISREMRMLKDDILSEYPEIDSDPSDREQEIPSELGSHNPIRDGQDGVCEVTLDDREQKIVPEEILIPHEAKLIRDAEVTLDDREQEILPVLEQETPSEPGSHKPIRDEVSEVSQEFGGSKYQDMCMTRASLKRKEKAAYEERKKELNKFMMEMVMKSREKRKRKLERLYSDEEQEIQAKQNAQLSLRFKRREHNIRRAMLKYTESEDLSHFEDDVKFYDSLYVFDITYAKLQSPEAKRSKFWDFIKYLTGDKLSKVYFGKDNYLAKTIHPSVDKIYGLNDDDSDIEPVILDSTGKKTLFCKIKSESLHKGELRPGLHKIAKILFDNNVGVLLTNQSKNEVLSKFEYYKDLDYVDAYDIPKESLVFVKDSFLPKHCYFRSSARSLIPKLLALGMPVELTRHPYDGEIIKLTKDFTICQAGVHVTPTEADILRLLKIKMFPYFVRPLCCWSASTGDTHSYSLQNMITDEVWASCTGTSLTT